MFDQEYYKRIVEKTTPKTINTSKPWFPQLKHRLAVKDYDYKFFVLPPNKMVSLLKKQKINIPSDEQIRDFLRNHSLKHIVKYEQDFKNVEKIQSNSPSPTVNQKNRKLFMQPQQNTNYKLIEPKPQTSNMFERQPSVQYVRELKSQQIEIRPNREINTQENRRLKLRIGDLSAKSTPHLDITTKKIPYRKRRRIELLNRSLKKIRLLGISIPELIEKQIFTKKAFSIQFSKEFIYAAKQNKIEQMQSFLITHPYLVFQFDYYNMTALHWACKYGYIEIVRMLLHYHADFDAIDLMNRTPLSLAIQEQNKEIVQLLLTFGAYPWSNGLTEIKTQNEEIRKIISQARKKQLFMKWSRIPQPTIN